MVFPSRVALELEFELAYHDVGDDDDNKYCSNWKDLMVVGLTVV